MVDTGHDALTYTATNLPSGLGIDAATGLITGQISSDAGAVSPFAVQIAVSDGQNTTQISFAWTVTDANPPACELIGYTRGLIESIP